MDAPFEVSFRHFEPTDRIRTRIDDLIATLDKLEGELVSGRVVVDGENRHGTKTVAAITVELSYPGGIAVGKRSGEFPNPAGQQTFDSALAEAFHAAAQQVRDHFSKRHVVEPTGPAAQTQQHGRIERLNPTVRNGFVEVPGSLSLFFSEAVLDGDFDRLRLGDEVLVIPAEGEGPYGPQARSVKPIGPLS